MQTNVYHFHEGAITRFLTLALADLTAEERAMGVEVVMVDDYVGMMSVPLAYQLSQALAFLLNVWQSPNLAR